MVIVEGLWDDIMDILKEWKWYPVTVTEENETESKSDILRVKQQEIIQN